MIPSDLVKRIRRIEITTRRAVEENLSGQYHSVFKGRGMDFSEVRAYAPGDEIRAIDWNVTARMNQLFVKQFVEERELTVMILVDLSASTDFGSADKTKAEVAAEIAALLAFSAVANGDRAGLILFTSEVERFVPPRKGRKHALRIVTEILQHTPGQRGTDIGAALEYLRRVIRRKSVAFVLSDFQSPASAPAAPPRPGVPADEPPFAQALRIAARKHDLVPVRLRDRLEEALPPLGLTWVEDPESGRILRVDLRRPEVRARFAEAARGDSERLTRLFARLRLDAVSVRADDVDYVKPLLAFFAARTRRHA
jgi:uncharacterized protein (DUF58 family)